LPHFEDENFVPYIKQGKQSSETVLNLLYRKKENQIKRMPRKKGGGGGGGGI